MATTDSSSSDTTAVTKHAFDFDGGDQQTLCGESVWRVARLAGRAADATCEACRQEAERRAAPAAR